MNILRLDIPIRPKRPEPNSQLVASIGTTILHISTHQFRLALHECVVVGDVTTCRITCSTRVAYDRNATTDIRIHFTCQAIGQFGSRSVDFQTIQTAGDGFIDSVTVVAEFPVVRQRHIIRSGR